MTTQEQLAKWRIEAITAFIKEDINSFGTVESQYTAGYLRAKQETEQAMKLAKFGAMAARKWANDAHGVVIYPDLDDTLIESIVSDVFDEENIAPNIEATIKELLK